VVRNPEFLFNTDLYRQTGSLFWQDVPNHTLQQSYLKDVAWELLDLPFRDEPPFESGQLLIDKRRCWRPLELTLHLNEHSDYYYSAFFGDKDTFHLAWHKLEQEYSLNPHPPAVLDNHIVLIQFDPKGKRLFQHRCNAKWTLTKKNMRIRGFVYEEECLRFLKELRSSWSQDFGDSSFTPAEQNAFDEIVSNNTFRVHLDGQEVDVCVFHSNLTLTVKDKAYGWKIEEDHKGNTVLIFTADGGGRLCFLRKTPQGSWAGRWRYAEGSSVELFTGLQDLQD